MGMIKDNTPEYRTCKGWYLKLPEPYSSQAIANLENPQSKIKANKITHSMSQAIVLGFLWGSTEQGEDYWRELYDKYLKIETMKPEVVRIAPSPTGKLHIGTLRTAYFNWLIAQQHPDSKLILRIDDTDLNRSQPELIDPIYTTLKELGIEADETFKQSDNFEMYRDVASKLIKKGYAKIDDGCVRLDKDALETWSCRWDDELTGKKEDNEDIENYAKTQVIIKSDGSPAYNFASTVDDILSGVTWVVRGVDHISNTYKQVLIYRILGYHTEIPKYSHVGLVCHKSGKKLSKRDSDELNLENIDKDALLNYILRLGWSPTEDTKANNIIDKDKAIKLFLDGGSMKPSNAKIDLDKLQWYDKKYKNFKNK